ncbi:hypothetical protein C446_17207 [Halobiforma nitratireducens JCM 10879]|uniref:Uncharacterized protein n=1 Tax=Halobiforma nitratireducens JCM 10879 TaxID=1227454 RepID=M0L757_9EURY|nr:hypothetical protein C446_17207 [Halobiforma nitratireducens JCM 10879]
MTGKADANRREPRAERRGRVARDGAVEIAPALRRVAETRYNRARSVVASNAPTATSRRWDGRSTMDSANAPRDRGDVSDETTADANPTADGRRRGNQLQRYHDR